MDPQSPDEPSWDRPRRPHWRKKSFWKTFGMVFAIYVVLRVSITAARNWSEGEAAPAPAAKSGDPEVSSPDPGEPLPENGRSD